MLCISLSWGVFIHSLPVQIFIFCFSSFLPLSFSVIVLPLFIAYCCTPAALFIAKEYANAI
jgi:hypothetical protein